MNAKAKIAGVEPGIVGWVEWNEPHQKKFEARNPNDERNPA